MFNTSFRKNNIVEIIDSIMGSYKTTNILKWMDDNPNNNYIYVSPLLSEVEDGGRVHRDLKSTVLEIPNNECGTKSDSLLSLLRAGDSIACTHSLYLNMNKSHFQEIAIQNYVVIIDEEVNVINGFDKYSKNDLKWLLSKEEISISEEDGMVSWVGNRDNIEGKHKYSDFLQFCDSKSLYSTRRSETMMVTQLPIKLFECAKQVIILTYMFDGNILDCFLNLKGFEVQKFSGIKTVNKDKKGIRELLTVIPPSNKIENYQMSSSWWADANGGQIKDVSNYIRNIAKNNDVSRDDFVWTVPKFRAVKTNSKSKNLVRPLGYSKTTAKEPCYLSAQTRATNDYRHIKAMVHCYNRRPLVPVSSYLQDYGYPVDFQVFATSELLQWVWRGCIRNNQPMILAIGSKRMYGYMMDWLNDDNV